MTRTTLAIALAACGIVYALALALLAREPGFSLVEPLFVLVVLGGAMGALAASVTRRTAAALAPVRPAGDRELVAVLGYLALFAILVLGFGFTAAKNAVTAEPAQSFVMLLVKLATMVVLPLALLAAVGRPLREALGERFAWRRHALPFVVVGAAILAFQAVFGRGLKTLGELDPTAATLAWAIPLTFAWEVVAAGLCEEVLFRVVLQGTLAARLRSNLVAIPVASVLFGLAHAPGLYLRGGNLMEGVGEASLAWAVAYSVAVIAPAGILFGVLWARTRSLWLVAGLHGLMDTIPHLAPTIRAWT